MYLDAADMAWQQWILAYNPGQQAALAFAFRNKLRSLGRDGGGLSWPGGTRPAIRSWLLLGLGIAAIVILLRVRWPRLWSRWDANRRLRKIRRGEGTANDARVLYESMLAAMAHRGFQKPAWFTPLEFARNLPAGEIDRNRRGLCHAA